MPAPNDKSRRRQRALVVFKSESKSKKIFAALQPMPNLDRKGISDFDQIAHEDFYETDILIIEHEFLYELRGAEAAAFKRLSRRASIIIALSSHQLFDASDVLHLGDAWLFTDYSLDLLPQAIVLSQSGYTILPTRLGITCNLKKIRHTIFDSLSPIEHRVLTVLGSGLTNVDIATRLDMNEARVKVIVRTIMQKMHFKNRTEAAIFMTLRENYNHALNMNAALSPH